MANQSTEYKIAIKIAGKVESSLKSSLGTAANGIVSMAKTCAKASVAAVAALGAMGVKAVNIGKDFENAMSQVAATMLIDRSTAEGQAAFETLENAARECGATTAFTATQAAEALNYLALAGYDADKAATALPTVLRLAGAGAMELAQASDMITDAMSALGIEATQSNLEGFADQMAKTASKANTSVSQLGEAILTVGGTAKYLTGGTTELNTCIGLLADNGIKGSEGGTKLRNMITSLTAPTDKAAAALDSLGVNVFDSKGEMRSMQSIFEDLNAAMNGMGTDKKSALLSAIFNKTDLKAVNALLGTSTERWYELSAAVENSSGACQEMYEIQLDNLKGDMDILQSATEDLAISAYQAMNGPLREAVQMATNWVGELATAFNEDGFSGLAGAIGEVVAEAVEYLAFYAPQLVQMAIILLTSFLNGITGASPQIAQAAAETLTVFMNGIFSMIPQLLLLGLDLILQFAQSMMPHLPLILQNGMLAINNFVQGIIERLPAVILTALLLLQTLVNSLGQNAPMLIQSALLLLQTLVNSLGQNAPILIQCALLLIVSLINGIVSMLPSILQMGLQLIIYLAEGILQNLPLILQSAVLIIVNLINSLTQMIPMIVQTGIQLIFSLIGGIFQNIPNIIQAAITIVLALAGGLISAIPDIIMATLSLVATFVETLLSGVFETNWFKAGWDLICAIGNGVLNGIKSIGSSIKNAITGWFTGGEGEEDAQYLGVHIAESYTDGLSSGTVSSQSAAAANANAALEGFSLDAGIVTTYGANLANNYADGINAGLPTATTAADTMGTDIINSLDTSLILSQPVLDTSALQIGTDLTTQLSNGIYTGLPTLQTDMEMLGTSTVTSLNESLLANQTILDESGLQMGTGFTVNMSTGIEMGMADVTALAENAGQQTMDAMDVGMNTGATNVQEIIDGISSSGGESFETLQTSVTTATTDTTSQITQLWQDASLELSNIWNSLSGKFASAWSFVHSNVINGVKNTVSAIKSAFENMTITIPRPSIPRVNVTYSMVVGGGGTMAQVPNFSVSYYAKGGIMTSPTAFGINPANGSTMVGGEAGAEAIVPLTELWSRMRSIISEIMASAMIGSGTPGFRELLDQIKGEKNPRRGGVSADSKMTITYAPVYHFEGGTPSKEDLNEAEKMSQEEFNRMMEKWKKDNDRKKF